jgi:hypothetical protein
MADSGAMPRYRLHHRHLALECRVVFASWNGFTSPLRHAVTLSSCATGGHEIWWDVEAESANEALAQLPGYVATRTHAIPIGEVRIP